MITEHADLTDKQRNDVLDMVGRAQKADGASPLNEAARLALRGAGNDGVIHWLSREHDDLVGYAQLQRRDGSVQLVIDPARRRRGLGRELAQRVRRSRRARTWWAFGDSAAAKALARSLGLVAVRGLLIMTLDARRYPWADDLALPAGTTLDHFRPADLDRLVAVNASAFANHPEQGALTADDFRARMASEWFRDEDLLVARDATGRLVGYHWTKLTAPNGVTRGEVYVLGVDPDFAGRGAGRALLSAGIIHMRSLGATHIDLYVEQSNERVVAMYRTAGFEVTHTDVAYGEAEED
ncbi:MAG: mycothiol synthase [Acidobacteriota bacterium]|nr:mycothiol synthase [Acidobacteriota bacterium]